MLFFGIFCVHTKWMIPYNAEEFLDYTVQKPVIV